MKRTLKAIGVGFIAYIAAGLMLSVVADLSEAQWVEPVGALLILVFAVVVGVRWYRRNDPLFFE